MIDINISWSCIHDHGNELTYNFDVLPGEDIDQMVEDFCSDSINQEEHPCQSCQGVGFNEVDWSYSDSIEIEPVIDESTFGSAAPAAPAA